MVYLYRNAINKVQLPFSGDVEDVYISINDGCNKYTLESHIVENCKGVLKAEITLPNLDLKGYLLTINNETEALAKYKVIVQKLLIDTEIAPLVAEPTQVENVTEWVSDLQSGSNWTVSFDGQLEGVNVELKRIVDESGQDVTDLLETVTIFRATNIIDIEFDEPVNGFIELTKNGESTN